MNEKKKINIILILTTSITAIIILAAIISCILFFKLNIKSKINYQQKITPAQDEVLMALDKKWAKKLLSGGYILHFRHTERDKWIDVQMYDVLESDVHSKGLNQSRMAENDYFKSAVCLNNRGLIQAKAIGELLREIKFPIGFVISSPSCRSRQTANNSFGGYDELNRNLVHRGAYFEKEQDHINKLKNIYLNLPIHKNKNTIVSSHNTVISEKMFDMINSSVKTKLSLEEGGFYVISKKNNKLILEYEFHNFNLFIRTFFPR